MTHICVDNLTIIGSDNGLSPERRQAIIWTNAGILLIGPLGTNFSEILIKIHTFSFKKIHLKMLSAKWRPFCLCLNVLSCKLSNFSWMSCNTNSPWSIHKKWGSLQLKKKMNNALLTGVWLILHFTTHSVTSWWLICICIDTARIYCRLLVLDLPTSSKNCLLHNLKK